MSDKDQTNRTMLTGCIGTIVDYLIYFILVVVGIVMVAKLITIFLGSWMG